MQFIILSLIQTPRCRCDGHLHHLHILWLYSFHELSLSSCVFSTATPHSLPSQEQIAKYQSFPTFLSYAVSLNGWAWGCRDLLSFVQLGSTMHFFYTPFAVLFFHYATIFVRIFLTTTFIQIPNELICLVNL